VALRQKFAQAAAIFMYSRSYEATRIRVHSCAFVVNVTSMILTGIGDEAGNTIEAQIAATKELGWQHIEARGVEAPGFPKANLHDIPDKAFDLVESKLKENGVGVYCFGSTIMNWAKTIETPWDVTLA